MMPADYISKSGQTVEFDLDDVFDLVGGYSNISPKWTATIIFMPSTQAFVELRSSPPDFRGDSSSESEEIDEEYVQKTFTLSASQIASFKSNPKSWQFIDLKKV